MGTISPAAVAAAALAGGFPTNQLVNAVAVAYAESSWNTDAANSCCYGLWQINKDAHPDLWARFCGGDRWKVPNNNAHAAYEIWRRAGGWCTTGRVPNCNPWQGYGNTRYNGAKGPAMAGVQKLNSVLAKHNITADQVRTSGNIPAVVSAELGGSIGDVVDASLPGPLGASRDAIQQIDKVMKFVTDKHNWQRFGLALGGMILLFLGMAPMFRGPAESIIKGGVKVASVVLPAGKAAKAAAVATQVSGAKS